MKFVDYLSSLKGKCVFVVGAGISNTPLIKALLGAGIDVTVCDRRVRNDIGEAAESFELGGARLRLGEDYLENLHADIIFRTPGLMPWNPALKKAIANGAVLTSEMEVFFDVCPCKIIGVTGSDGKTTTTSIIGEMIRREYAEDISKSVHVGGNIGTPLLCKADSMNTDDIVVLELSSFQLMTMRKSPHIAVVTNLSPNHLDAHANMGEYVEAKRNILAYQNEQGRAVLNFDNSYTRSFAASTPAKKVFFSSRETPKDGVFLNNGEICSAKDGRNKAIMQVGDIFLPGRHNVENYMAAIAAVQGLVSDDAIVETAREFRGVPHRIEFVGEFHGVRYYNDSTASTPTRAIAGLLSFDRKVILIAGGKGKGVSFDEFGKIIVKHVKSLFLTGKTAEQIRDAVTKAPGYDGMPEIRILSDFSDAVIAASKSARAGDVVLLSPACTSFDRFKNFEERGNVFKEIVRGNPQSE